MADAWEEIQAVQRKRNSLRERLEKRKKQREGILVETLITSSSITKSEPSSSAAAPLVKENLKVESEQLSKDLIKIDPELEQELLKQLASVSLQLPVSSKDLMDMIKKVLNRDLSHKQLCNHLQKFTTQKLISIRDILKEDGLRILEVFTVEVSKVNAMIADILDDELKVGLSKTGTKRPREEIKDFSFGEVEEEKKRREKKEPATDILSLLAMPSIKEKETKKIGEEILDLLSKPTAKEKSLTERFKSQGGKQLMEFCPHGTKLDCEKNGITDCKKLHFKKIIQKHTDESLGDCSFLNTCFHMDTCKYVHYEVDRVGQNKENQLLGGLHAGLGTVGRVESTTLYPAQWVQCDLRYLDMTVLGKFAVIMADPPWDIHMELPYGTMSDDEMRQLGIPQLQDEGLIFLWVTGRAMELGRECLKLWGYERVDEIIWVKTNQLQRIIRTDLCAGKEVQVPNPRNGTVLLVKEQ
ncbi:N6-adenosine-methyltransferase subunit METTL3 isoform X2 [Anthonomus grandis grandis]|uniref:N6-adenosine-methyltransferase subunit METTL3 isoform X2 n=1 Tax=Anthonomus grandis grandis TaxID=2921223 RepID=UPI002165F6F2|nr:N6-adenosine-methyltransferase subunit METTL3 isoform X2 [Anthonomus grandis grandis]